MSEVGGAGIDEQGAYPPLQVSFMVSNCLAFEWESQNLAYGNCMVSASDGLTNYYSSVSIHGALFPGMPYFYRVDLPYTTNWNVTIFLAMDDGFTGLFAGINVPSGSKLMPHALPPQRTMVVLGDSYAKGYVPPSDPAHNTDGSQYLAGFAMDLQMLGSNVKVFPAGVGGQGYVNPNNNPPTYQGRLTNDVINLNPDFVLVTGSINDNGFPTNQVYDAALKLYQTLTNALPHAKIGVIGNWYKWLSGPTADDIGRDVMLQAAAQQCGLPYASPVQGLWGGGGVSSDSVHPTAALYLQYAQNINSNLIAWWGAIWQDGAISAYNSSAPNSTTISANSTSNLPGTTTNSTAKTLNVADFGAHGDTVFLTVSTTSNSPVVSVVGTNIFTSADVGKVIEVFRAGPQISYNGSVVVTRQDIICTITSVDSSGQNLSLSIPCGYTMNAYCIVGANNAAAFQAAINAADTNTIIQVPRGTYLLIAPHALDPNYVTGGMFDNQPAVTIAKGGIQFVGDSAATTILMGCGAGMNHRVSVMSPSGAPPYLPFRGSIFYCTGPVANSQYPLVFNNLTFDGGLTNGLQSYNYFTIIQASGDGWDTSHDAILDWSPGDVQMHQYKLFENCIFQHWRGEILKSTVGAGGTNTFITITNCTFTDGNASAFNFTFAHDIEGCSFSRLVKVLEFYQSYALTNSTFANNVWTNIASNPFSIVGSVQKKISQPYLIANNNCSGIPNVNQISFSPAENVTISNNVFHGQSTGIAFTGVGVQPSDGTASWISNIVVAANAFNDTYQPIYMDGYPVVNVVVSGNTSAGTYIFAVGVGYKANVVFKNNTGSILDSRGITGGTYFYDDVSDNMAPWWSEDDLIGRTNALTYAQGHHHRFYAPTNAVYFLDTSNPNLIPAGAAMQVERISGQFAGPASIPVYASAKLSAPVQLSTGQSITFYWTNGAWLTADQMQVPSPPGHLRIIQTGN